jgi:hypothetical protein
LATNAKAKLGVLNGSKRVYYKTIADDAVTQQYRHSALGVHPVVVVYKRFVRHALLLLHQDGRLDDFPEASGVGVASLEGLGHHVGQDDSRVATVN